MSVLYIPEDLLRRLGPSDRDALTEIATRLYETGRLRFDEAARLAGGRSGQNGGSLRCAEDPGLLVQTRGS